MSQEFKAWREITKFQGIHVVITEKIHGSNGQILVYRDEAGQLHALAGSRTQFLDALGRDNFGFAAYVKANEAEICEKLGEGTHYGEWVGPGINGGYNLKEKNFVLFDYRRHPKEKYDAGGLPPRMLPIPVLYDGPITINSNADAVEIVMDNLKRDGSRLTPGFMNPEGVVINFPQFGAMKKKVFKEEETSWTKPKKIKDPNAPAPVDPSILAAPFLQPIRLEKLMMKDETYRTGFPQNLPVIVKAYLDDLFKEMNRDGRTPPNEEQLKAVKKCAFMFVKDHVELSMAKDFMGDTDAS